MSPNAQPAAPEDNPETADALGYQLVRFVRLLNKATAQLTRAQPDGIEQGAFAILGNLVRGGPQRTSALAEALHIEISTVSRQVSSLVQHGFLRREADPDDGRACLLAPTDEGLRVYEATRSARNQWLATTVSEWDPQEVEQLITLLDRLNTDLAHVPVVPADGSAPGATGGAS